MLEISVIVNLPSPRNITFEGKPEVFAPQTLTTVILVPERAL
jgi:hypothetical protein